MLNPDQRALLDAIQDLDVLRVKQLLALGLDPNFIDSEQGPPISVLTDRLYDWWEKIDQAYEANKPLTEMEKEADLAPYLTILQDLITANANIHLWDAEESYGPLWDAASAACAPVVTCLLEHGVNPNSIDDDQLTILSSICDLWFDCDYDQVNWSWARQEQKQTLELMRQYGAKMSKELES